MRRLIVLILLIAAALAALLVAPQVIGEKGYVLISMGSTVIEMTVVSLVICIVLGLLGLWLVWRIVSWLKGVFTGSRQWFGSRSKRKRQRYYYKGIQAFAAGNLEEANKAFGHALDGEFEGTNLLLQAQVNNELGNWERTEQLLNHAADYEQARVAARVMQARMLVAQNKPQQALEALNQLGEEDSKARAVVALKAECLAQTGQWQQIQHELPHWRRVLKKDAVPLAQRAAKGKFAEVASKQGANALKQYWQELPRKQRNDIAFQAAYVDQLIEQGMHHDAQDCLVDWQKDGLKDELVPMLRRLRMSNPASAIQLMEKAIKQDSMNPQYYSVLGQLAFNAGDLSLAERALMKAIKLKEDPADLMLLAEVSERQNDNSKALAFYKQGMSAVS